MISNPALTVIPDVSTQGSDILTDVGNDLIKRLPITSIDLIPLTNSVDILDLRRLFPDERLVATDFYINGAENARLDVAGFDFESEDIFDVDHHAPHPKMYRAVSSGNLAIEYVKNYGPVPGDARVIVNHTDCDSVIAALILRGLLPPLPEFAEAVLAADHFGSRNEITDLLQALDSRRDINFSARNLALLLAGQPIESSAAKLLGHRMTGRAETEQAVGEFADRFMGRRLAVIELNERMRNEFLPALLPDAVVILTHERGRDGAKNMRLRLGAAAPEGFTLFSLPLKDLDPAMGGRWNAASNKRGGGSHMPVDRYVQSFESALEGLLG